MSQVFNNWYRFQKYAQEHGFDSLKFAALFATGLKECRWLDAYFGFIVVEGMDGFVTVAQLDEIARDVPCFLLDTETEETP